MRNSNLFAVGTMIGLVVAGSVPAQTPLDPPPALPNLAGPQMVPLPGTVPVPVQNVPPPTANAATFQPAPATTSPTAPTSGGVGVEKHGPESVTAGQPLAYEIVVRNSGSTAAQQVRVEDELPAGSKYLNGEPSPEIGADKLSWVVNAIEPGAEKRIHVRIQPGPGSEFHSTATVHYTATASLQTKIVQPKLVLAMRAPESAGSGENVAFSVMVTNPGTMPVTNLLLHCKLPDGLTHPQGQVVEAEVGLLAAGETRNVTLTTKAIKPGKFTNEMSATAEGGVEAKAEATVEIKGATLQLSRTGPARCYLKSEVGFELEVVNCGAVQAATVELGDTLPAGLEFVSATEGGKYDPANRTILWKLPALAAGDHQKVAYRVKAVGLGEMPDRAAARGEGGPDVKADGTFTVEGVPALSLEVVDLEDPIPTGADLTYEIRVVNQGSCPCTNLQIVAQVPEGLQTKEGSGPTAFKPNGADVAFEPLPKLAVKADAVYRVKVRGVQPGDYRFRVQMTCDQLRQPVMKEEASRVYKDGQ